MRAISKKLNELNTKRHERDIIQKRIDQLNRQRMYVVMRLDELQRDLKEEENDLAKLEKVALSSIVNALLTSKVEKLESEKQKVYMNRLKYEQTKDEYAKILKEMDKLTSQIREYDEVEQAYLKVVEEVEQYILQFDQSEAATLRLILAQKEDFEKEYKQYDEAIKIGTEVLSELNNARKSLEKAKKWGDYDLLGGGMVATIQKYAYLDDAQEQLHKIQWIMKRYHNELNGAQKNVEIEISEFLDVADYWIEGIFEDYSIQNAIDKLMNSLEELIAKVIQVDEIIRKELKDSHMKVEAMKLKCEKFLMSII